MYQWRGSADSIAEPGRSTSFRLCRFFFAILRRSGRFEGMNELCRDSSDLIDGSNERSFIRFRRLVEPGDFSHELEGCRAHLFGGDGRSKIENRFDIPAHVIRPLSDFNDGGIGSASGSCFGARVSLKSVTAPMTCGIERDVDVTMK